MEFNYSPDILALDFDGVICDGLIEYFQTAWMAYCQVWQPANSTPPSGLAEQFYPLRPVIETGWEMPVLLRSLLSGTPAADILADWPTIARAQIQTDGVAQQTLARAVDGSRDRWINNSLDDWLKLHRFYPGVLKTLTHYLQSPTHTVIISTKEGRFIDQLLRRHGVAMPRELIHGKEVKAPKYETLRRIIHQHSDDDTPVVTFVEDRLKALQAVETQSDLAGVSLYLADWGYNTALDRKQVSTNKQSRVQLLTLETFTTVK